MPAAHVAVPWAVLHTVPHVPQLATSLVVSTHAPLQAVVPDGQVATHAPDAHTSSAPQCVPHAPQLAGSAQAVAASRWSVFVPAPPP